MGPVQAQIVVDVEEELDSERPEAWALRWFAATLAPSGFGNPGDLAPGAIELGLDAAWIPSLSTRERTVGFNGTKTEDLNRSPLASSVRARVGLPARFALEGAWMPPIEVDGARPNLFSLAVAREIVARPPWRLAARLGFQSGTVEGDFTCPQAAAAAGEDPIANPYRCEAASNDEMSFDSPGLEFALARRFAGTAGIEAWVTASLRRVDSTFDVDAQYAGVVDRSRLDYSGEDWGLAAGLGGLTSSGLWRWGAEVAWVPLEIRRAPGRATEDEPLIHARLLFARRLR